MSNLLVVSSTGDTYSPPASILKASAAKFGYKLYWFTDPWSDYVGVKVLPMLELLKRGVPADYVMFSDRDCLLTAPEAELIKKFENSSADILLSTENACWPDPDLAEQYPPSIFPWRFLNAGGIIGKQPALLKAYEWVATHKLETVDDQRRWTAAFLRGGLGIQLDTTCEVFQTMSGDSARHLKVDANGRLHNILTGSGPCHLHFNGKLPGIEEWWEKLK
jgi:hypothetical protein